MSRMTENQIREALVDARAIQTGKELYPDYKDFSPRYHTSEVGECCVRNLGKWVLGAKYFDNRYDGGVYLRKGDTVHGMRLSGQSYSHCRTCGLSRIHASNLLDMGRTWSQSKILSIDGQVVG